MKIFRRCLLFLLIIFTFLLTPLLITTSASNITLIPIPRTTGGNVKYRNTQIDVLMPSEYIRPETDFRAVWVSTLVNDISSYSSPSQFKAQMYSVLETMEYFNMNAMIFHVRMNNDAMYKSNLNPVANAFSRVNFNEFDPIEWLIEECHKRGIEFHAWLNPYRLASSLGGLTIEDFAKRYERQNAASNPNNILSSATGGVILNPGEPAVRRFVIDTVMEIIENYNVDAIHFDDYFYVKDVDDKVTRDKWNFNNLSIDDFRRQQVDIFVESLSNEMRQYNQQNNRFVQLGISPTGIYRNGSYSSSPPTYDTNGNMTSPIGSNTSGFAHYGYYLYADTKKWVDKEWIDYIVPQSYHSFQETAAPYADVMDWWVKAIKYKNVNLYSGMGLYMASDSARASWFTNPLEAANQVQFASQYPEIKGHTIFSYQHLFQAYNVRAGTFFNNMNNIRQTMWNRPAILPEVRTFDSVNLGQVNNLQISKTSAGYRLDFSKIEEAKFYVIYRSSNTVTYSPDEVIAIFGDVSKEGVISYIDQVSTNSNYTYGVKPMSQTNTLGTGRLISTTSASPNGNLLTLGNIENITVTENTFFGATIDVKWDTLYAVFGEKPNYEVFLSTDGINYSIVSTDLIKSPISHILKLRLGNDPKVYLKIRAFNAVGETISSPVEINVSTNIGPIKNFTVLGEIYGNRTIELVWNALPFPNIDYAVQYSTNKDNWTTITNADPIEFRGVNAVLRYTLPNEHSNMFYRVIATTSTGKAISQEIQLESFIYLGDIDVKINGFPYSGPVVVNEGDVVDVSWNPLSLNNANASYRTMMSGDKINWLPASVFSSQNGTVIGTTQKLKFGFQHYTVYYRVEALTQTGFSVSEIIEFRVNLDYQSPSQLTKHMNRLQKNLYSNIYK